MAVTLQDILQVDGGEAYIKQLVPDAEESFRDRRRKFKLRDENTASASLFRHQKEGFWMVKDFGSSDRAMHAIQLKMFLSGVDFSEARRDAAAFYGLESSAKSLEIRPDYNARPAKPEEQPGHYDWELKELELHELRTIFADGAWHALGRNDDECLQAAIQLCQYYHLKAVKWYSHVDKEGKTVHIFSSNDRFPIFLWDEGQFQKLYKPKDEKAYRFITIGNKPEHFIHGLSQHQKKLAEANDILIKAYNEKIARNEKAILEEEKFEKLILCTGGSDALNVAALGYEVVWLNSETADLRWVDYKALDSLCDHLYNLPDIDPTGVEQAKALAIKYLEIRTIWLPSELRKRTDWRGNTCKDVRDYLRYYRRKDFRGLTEVAYPYRFWDEEYMFDKTTGEPKKKFGRWQMNYQFNNVYGYNFLSQMGFGRFVSEKEKDGYFFVRIEKNVVKRVEANDIKNFLHGFLQNYTMPNGGRILEDLRNVLYRSPQLSESSMSNLGTVETNFRYYGTDFQYFFFNDQTWKITPGKVEKAKAPDVQVWEQKVLKIETKDRFGEVRLHKANVEPPMFRAEKKDGQWDIEILNTQCDALNFLIQTAKVHWRTELEERLDFWKLDKKAQAEYIEKHDLSPEELKNLLSYQHADRQKEYRERTRFRLDGELLLPEEVAEQKQALINRLFALGYMLHRYKRSEWPWAVFAMDYRISDEGQSNGGAGKGLVAKMLYRLLQYVPLDGRNENLLVNPHVFENVDKDTDMIHIEDMSEFFPFKALYTPLTSSININPKNKRSITLSYEEYGKFWIDTNFGDRNTDQSSKRRKLYTVFSDYYHEDLDYYREVRTPKTELGRSMFEEWPADQWNLFYNLMAQCVAFYLTVDEKVEPPTTNLNKRNLMSTMGDNFRVWADVYFDPESGRLNDWVQKKPAMEDFVTESKLKISPQLFMKKVEAWCRLNHYELNPEDLLGGKPRKIDSIEVIQKDGTRKTTTAEFIYIRTPKPKAPKNDFPTASADDEIDF